MEILEIIRIQKEFDERHGWLIKSSSPEELINYLSQDSIGLLGELGEFANHIKKMNLLLNHREELNEKLNLIKEELSGELVDVFIYLIRLATHLETDIEKEYFKKLSFNEKRFKKYEQ